MCGGGHESLSDKQKKGETDRFTKQSFNFCLSSLKAEPQPLVGSVSAVRGGAAV